MLQVPSARFTDAGDTDGIITVWPRTTVKKQQVDRMGKPEINGFLIPESLLSDVFNLKQPADDLDSFGSEVKDSLLTISALDGSPYTDFEAEVITTVLLPDVLTLDTSSGAGFLNGRRLEDDVIDMVAEIFSGGFFGGTPVVDSDCIDANDVPFPGSFPYLAPPHP